MTKTILAAFAGLFSLAASAQIPSPPSAPAVGAGADMKQAVRAKADTAVDTGDAVKGATGAGSEKAKLHAKKAHAGARSKSDKASNKVHKKVEDLAK